MTNEQVKEILKHELVEMTERYGGDYSGVEAMKIAIQCFEAQIPKKAYQNELDRKGPDKTYSRMRYNVYFKSGEKVQIIADNFNSNYDKGYVIFSLESRNVAIFSFDSIIGFSQEAEEDEEG